jgi:hypothetical protein
VARHRVDTMVVIGEQVDVFGGTGDNAMDGEGVAARQREPVLPRGPQRDPRDLRLERVQLAHGGGGRR